MANTVLTPNIIAKEALYQFRKNAVMANLVHRDYSKEFVKGVGDTITIRKPATFEAKEFESQIELQDATETPVEIKMDKHLDVSFAVTSKELALDIADFSDEFIIPAMKAFADKVDKYLIELQASVTNRVNTSGSRADIVEARKYLTTNAVPLTNRNYVYNADVEAELLLTDLFTNASQVGDNGTALREASLGRKFGMDFYVDQNIGTASATSDPLALAFHKNAFALVTRPLEIPSEKADGYIENYDGFGIRVMQGYDMNTKKQIMSLDMLCGVKLLDSNLAAVVQKA